MWAKWGGKSGRVGWRGGGREGGRASRSSSGQPSSPDTLRRRLLACGARGRGRRRRSVGAASVGGLKKGLDGARASIC